LGLVGAVGYYSGPVRAAFTLFGLFFGTLLAGPLSPLTQRLLSVCGLHHPAWNIFAPQVLGFLIVLTIFKIAGQVVHRKIAVYFKYKVDDKTLYRWQRVYSRLGLCVGLLNGSFYFILLMLLMYSAGYFTTEAASGDSDPASAKLLTETRAQLHNLKLDRVLATYDMVPDKVYETADAADLLLHNPRLKARLGHYPPCMQLSERQDFKDLAHDETLLQMMDTQAKIIDIINYPKVYNMLTNSEIVAQVKNIIGPDLDDLTNYLVTGQSAKYDADPILGVWNINRAATVAEFRKEHKGVTPSVLRGNEEEMFPYIKGLSLMATPDQQVVLKKQITVVSAGTWKKDPDGYKATLPGMAPEESEVSFEDGDTRLLLAKKWTLVFDKER
jgi:hypothetical protein